MSETTAAPPASCTLEGERFEQRLAWIARLNVRAVKAARRDDLRLELDCDPSARAEVEQLIAQERSCCAFLSFELAEASGAITLTITAPDSARDAAELLFGPFGEKGPRLACGCVGACGA